jgi:hypothetical protein
VLCRQLVTGLYKAELRIQFQATPLGNCDGKIVPVQVYSVILYILVSIKPTVICIHFFVILGMDSWPIRGHSSTSHDFTQTQEGKYIKTDNVLIPYI